MSSETTNIPLEKRVELLSNLCLNGNFKPEVAERLLRDKELIEMYNKKHGDVLKYIDVLKGFAKKGHIDGDLIARFESQSDIFGNKLYLASRSTEKSNWQILNEYNELEREYLELRTNDAAIIKEIIKNADKLGVKQKSNVKEENILYYLENPVLIFAKNAFGKYIEQLSDRQFTFFQSLYKKFIEKRYNGKYSSWNTSQFFDVLHDSNLTRLDISSPGRRPFATEWTCLRNLYGVLWDGFITIMLNGATRIIKNPKKASRVRVSLFKRAGVVIGENVFIGKDVYLDPLARYNGARDNLPHFKTPKNPRSLTIIEDDVTIEDGVKAINHEMRNEYDGKHGMGKIVFGKGCLVKKNAIIRAGTIIGEGAIVEEGTAVNRDVPPYSYVSGIPGIVIYKDIRRLPQGEQDRLRNEHLTYDHLEELVDFHNMSVEKRKQYLSVHDNPEELIKRYTQKSHMVSQHLRQKVVEKARSWSAQPTLARKIHSAYCRFTTYLVGTCMDPTEWRPWFLRNFVGAKKLFLWPNCIKWGKDVFLAHYFFTNHYYIDAFVKTKGPYINLEDGVAFGAFVKIICDPVDGKLGKLTIQKNAMIGADSVIHLRDRDITIGKNTQIAARSYITEDVPANKILIISPGCKLSGNHEHEIPVPVFDWGAGYFKNRITNCRLSKELIF